MDCSVTKRKGCNYCLRNKNFGHNHFDFTIDDETKQMFVIYDNKLLSYGADYIVINY